MGIRYPESSACGRREYSCTQYWYTLQDSTLEVSSKYGSQYEPQAERTSARSKLE